MNERIYELYRQAHLVREYPADDPMRGGNPPTVYWGGDESAKKFAELIVRKCARVAFESDLTMAIGQWGADSAILKHFGVEE
jgi:hypothetical protein